MADAAVTDLMFSPVSELAAMVRSGVVSARELVEISLDRIEELDPQLNAFIEVDADRALAAADAVRPGDERPFAGVPIAIKNNRAVSGLRLTYATPLLSDRIADYDHNVTRRFKQAGFIVVGTTALPEHGILPVTESRLLGPTRNPWDTGRTPGGSSGGSAAAVAAGLVPIAHGNDGGGSTRIPAACCGLVGLKSQRNRISVSPEAGESFLTIDGVLTRTVAESAALLDLLAGYEVGDTNWAPPPAEPFATAAAGDPGRLRIATTTKPPLDATVHAAGLNAVRETAELLESLGHSVEEIEPPWVDPQTLPLFTVEFAASIGASIAYSAQVAGRDTTSEDMEPLSWALWELARGIASVDYRTALAQLQRIVRRVLVALAPYDAVLVPMLAEPPVPIGEIDSCAPEPMSAFVRAGLFTPFSAMFNVSGQPAISLPLFEDEQGLPLAVQLVARPADEGRLLALSAQLEAARPWVQRRPPVS